MSQFVVRPGETDYDAQDRIQGALDLPLNAHGQAQVDEMIETLRGVDLDVIYASPSEPSHSTAVLIGEALQIPVKTLEGLANSHLGLWQGLPRSEVRQKQSRVFRQWEESPESVCPPCGESPEELIERIERSLRKPMRRGGSFAIVVSDPVATFVTRMLTGTLTRPLELRAAPGTCTRLDALEPVDALH